MVIAACAPLVLLVADMLQRYPLDGALKDIGFVDALLLASKDIDEPDRPATGRVNNGSGACIGPRQDLRMELCVST